MIDASWAYVPMCVRLVFVGVRKQVDSIPRDVRSNGETAFSTAQILTVVFSTLPDVRRRFQRIVEALKNYDRAHGSDLFRTVKYFVEADRCVGVTARRLEVHRHTVVYRLGQVERILNRSLKKGDGRYILELALLASAVPDSSSQ